MMLAFNAAFDAWMNAHPIIEGIVCVVIVVLVLAIMFAALMGSLGRDV